MWSWWRAPQFTRFLVVTDSISERRNFSKCRPIAPVLYFALLSAFGNFQTVILQMLLPIWVALVLVYKKGWAAQ